MKRIGYIFFPFVCFINSCTSKSERIKPVLSNITESVYAAGKVKAEGQYQAYSTVNGIVTYIGVYPGESVKPGNILLVLDNNIASLNTENSRLAVELSKSNYNKNSEKLREMELNVKLALDRYLLDSSLFARQSKLWEQNVGTKLDFENRRQALISSANNYQSAKSKLSQLKLQLKNDLERTLISYKINRKTESDYIIRSNVTGKVFDILIEKGELVTPQTPLVVLGSANFILEMDVDENDITKLKTGQTAAITMDSYKGQVFDGVIDKIYPIMEEKSSTFKVWLRFVNPPPALYPNLTAEANIIIKTKKNAVIIPRTFLQAGQYVWTAKNKKTKVKTGLMDYQKVEITEGLDTSDFIYKPQNAE